MDNMIVIEKIIAELKKSYNQIRSILLFSNGTSEVQQESSCLDSRGFLVNNLIIK